MTDPQSSTIWPQYQITLTADQATELGRLTVVWGQIDHFVFNSVSLLLTPDPNAAIAMLGDLTTGPLVNLLNKSRHRIKDDNIKSMIKTFHDDMGSLIKKRNHIMHGMWGLFLPGKDAKKAKPACFYAKNPLNPIFAEDIHDLANKAAEQTHVISTVFHHIAEISPPEGTPKFYFGAHIPRMPKGSRLERIVPRPKNRPRST
jgi:hypothetical protein